MKAHHIQAFGREFQYVIYIKIELMQTDIATFKHLNILRLD